MGYHIEREKDRKAELYKTTITVTSHCQKAASNRLSIYLLPQFPPRPKIQSPLLLIPKLWVGHRAQLPALQENGSRQAINCSCGWSGFLIVNFKLDCRWRSREKLWTTPQLVRFWMMSILVVTQLGILLLVSEFVFHHAQLDEHPHNRGRPGMKKNCDSC